VPFTEELEAFIRNHDRTYVVEMNTDGQMQQLVQLEVPEMAGRIRSIRNNDGLPLTARWIVDRYAAKEGEADGRHA
jgi:2-oxoglutarate ferredoxin oxidoreductase subunit alpha